MSETPSYPALIELISRLEGKDRKTCEMALYCLNKADRRDKRLRDRTEDIAEENVKLRAENEKLQSKCEFIYDGLLEAKGQAAKLRAALKPFADLDRHWESDKMPLQPKTIMIEPLPILYAIKALRNEKDEVPLSVVK